MEALDFTKLSTRGQIVIPQEVRDRMELRPGETFAVTGHGDTIVLKRVVPPSFDDFQDLLKRTRTWAAEAGIKRKDVAEAIRKARSQNRH